jgi:hypothetical protein
MAKRILIRRDTTVNWQLVNPILSNGELGIEIKNDGTRKAKLGTGSAAWNNLDYFIDDFVKEQELIDHEINTSAHYATDNPTANLIAKYNSDKGLKSDKIPTDLNDVIRKTELNNISGVISGIITDIDTVENNLNTEINNRITNVSGLQYNIDTVENNLNTETYNRIIDVSGLQYNIDIETANRITNVSGLQFDIDILGLQLDTEISGLQQNIDTEISGLQYNLDTEINNRISAISGVVYTASEDATNKADIAESNAKQYADDLALATQKWLPAVNTSAELPANPGDGTYLCRVITGDDYGVYQWIGTQPSPSWTYFSDNLDFIDRIANPVTDDLPIITSNGELIDSGVNISGIFNTVSGWVNAKEDIITPGTNSQYYRGDKTWQSLSKNDFGLGNVDNTSDVDKPISTAVSGALFGKVDVSELDNYYTETETDTLLSGKVNVSELDNYYTETETDTLLSEKEPLKYIAEDETSAESYSASHSDIMVFYPEE